LPSTPRRPAPTPNALGPRTTTTAPATRAVRPSAASIRNLRRPMRRTRRTTLNTTERMPKRHRTHPTRRACAGRPSLRMRRQPKSPAVQHWIGWQDRRVCPARAGPKDRVTCRADNIPDRGCVNEPQRFPRVFACSWAAGRGENATEAPKGRRPSQWERPS